MRPESSPVSGNAHQTAGAGTGASHVTDHAVGDGARPGAVLLDLQIGSAAGG